MRYLEIFPADLILEIPESSYHAFLSSRILTSRASKSSSTASSRYFSWNAKMYFKGRPWGSSSWSWSSSQWSSSWSSSSSSSSWSSCWPSSSYFVPEMFSSTVPASQTSTGLRNTSSLASPCMTLILNAISTKIMREMCYRRKDKEKLSLFIFVKIGTNNWNI